MAVLMPRTAIRPRRGGRLVGLLRTVGSGGAMVHADVGIKMSGMPSMASDGDEMLWATVALLRKLPNMSEDDYNSGYMPSANTLRFVPGPPWHVAQCSAKCPTAGTSLAWSS
jgi:hypothetical protein